MADASEGGSIVFEWCLSHRNPLCSRCCGHSAPRISFNRQSLSSPLCNEDHRPASGEPVRNCLSGRIRTALHTQPEGYSAERHDSDVVAFWNNG